VGEAVDRGGGYSDEGVASVSVSLIASRLPTSSSQPSSPFTLLTPIDSPRARTDFAVDITASSLHVSEVAPDNPRRSA